MKEEEINRLLALQAFLEAFKRTDRRSINNGFYVGQCISKLPELYSDFEEFGGLGVSSFGLNWDYSNLRMNFKESDSLPKSVNVQKKIGKVAKTLSQYSPDELKKLSLFCINGGNLLSKSERETAKRRKAELLQKL